MIKSIMIISKRELLKSIKTLIFPVSSWALISIFGERGNEEAIISDSCGDQLKMLGCKTALSLNFEDLTEKTPFSELEKEFPGRKFHLFDSRHARSIIDFVTKVDNKNINTLVAQCSAGISRSGAVGLWACRYLGMDEKKFMQQNKNIMPNFYVLRILNEVSGINNDYLRLWLPKATGANSKKIFI